MDYKNFYKNELFPENEVLITDALLKKNKWLKVIDPFNPKTKFYYFDNGLIGRIHVIKNYFGKGKNSYTLCLNYKDDDCRNIRKISDIKAAIYSYVCGQTGTKYGPNKDGLYSYQSLETEEEMQEWRYNEYCKMVKAIEKI